MDTCPGIVDRGAAGWNCSMIEVLPPFRRAFDAARDPYAARNALGIVPGLISAPVAFSALPAIPILGERAFITDATVSTFGSNVTIGGGTNKVPVFYNGVNWIVG